MSTNPTPTRSPSARPAGPLDLDYPEEVLRSAWTPEIEDPWWRGSRRAPTPRRRPAPVQPLVLVDGVLDEFGTA
jgi:hypothetical protein